MIDQTGLRLVHCNNGASPKTFWFEPWADEIVVAPGATIEVECDGAPRGTLQIEENDGLMTVWSPSGALLTIKIDGMPLDCGSTTIPVPDFGELGPKGMVQIAFGNFPEARPSGVPFRQRQTVWKKLINWLRR